MKKKKAKLRRRRQSHETNRSAIIKARFEWGKNVGPKTKKRWSGKIRGGGGGSPRRALARYAFMARVSNFTCNNETRRDSKEGSDERSGKAAQAYRRWASIDDRGKDARNEIGQRSGERRGGEGEEDDIRVEEARSVPSPFLRFPRPPFPTTRPQNTALTTDITSEKPCRSGIPSRSDGESSRQTFHPFIFLPLPSTSPSFLPFCYGIDTLENSPDNPNITKTKRTTTSPWISKTFR